MPTASTGPEQAEIAITEEKLADDVPLTPEPSIATTDETAGTDLEGLAALIEQNAAEEPVKTKKKSANPSATASELPQPLEVTSADDVKLTAEGREFGAKTGGTRLILRAKAPVWVRIEDTSGNVVMTQMLMKGDTYRVPDREGLVVIARDGGLLAYVIDGEEKGVLGTPGEILVGRPLDVKALDAQG
jgi:cytoskeleton protein RodZ